MAEILFPAVLTGGLILDNMNEEKFYQTACLNLFFNELPNDSTTSPGSHGNVTSESILQNSMNSFVVVKASDRKSESYNFNGSQ